ncbi:hypothetical protein LIER_28905 [Lithospermum erythrorhizon]|uniref:Reverse transcriptase Ty1/copia-type domain-containing protein n=1 Tax=Lithospermum erythrorhizon TaxID=34254 RepID=A0AAV3RL03_LITER
MQVPDGYHKAKPGQVCKLTRFLCGFKQASRKWNQEFTMQLVNYGFKQSYHDNCLFVLKDVTRFIVYVDDILLAGSSLEDMRKSRLICTISLP